MVRLGATPLGVLAALGVMTSMAARAAAPLTIAEVSVDTSLSQIVVTGHDFGSGRGLQVTLGAIGDITRVCSLQATSPQTVVCDFSRVGLPPRGDYRIALVAGGNPGESDQFDLTIGPASAGALVAESGRTVEVALGWNHACARRANGTITCWGDDEYGESTPPTNTFRQLASGLFTTCGVKTSGAVRCWGVDAAGQVSGAPGGTFTQVVAGRNHACGLRPNGSLACWGLSLGSPPPAGSYTQIAAGSYHACGLRTDGSVACWGPNYYNQVSPVPAGSFTQVVSGEGHNCALEAAGSPICWGDNSANQTAPVPAGPYTRLAAGAAFTCGIKTDSSLACWGVDDYGQVSSAPSGSFSQIAAGRTHACGVKTDGSVACWGTIFVGGSVPGPPSPPAPFP